MTAKQAAEIQRYRDELARYREALEKIESMKHVRRAYRHTKYEELIRIAQDALRGS